MKVFEKDRHSAILGDAIEALSTWVPDGSIDLIFADPPYNIGKVFNETQDKWQSDEDYLRWCYRWLVVCQVLCKSADGATWHPRRFF